MQKVSDHVYALECVVLAAAERVVRTLDNGVVGVVKPGPGASHHSIGTKADDECQADILGFMRSAIQGVKFLAEEDCVGPDVLTDENMAAALFDPGQMVCVVDSVDGTASAYRQRWDWSVVSHLLAGGQWESGCLDPTTAVALGLGECAHGYRSWWPGDLVPLAERAFGALEGTRCGQLLAG